MRGRHRVQALVTPAGRRSHRRRVYQPGRGRNHPATGAPAVCAPSGGQTGRQLQIHDTASNTGATSPQHRPTAGSTASRVASRCRKCGVRLEPVPRARSGTAHTRDLEDVATWPAQQMAVAPITRLLRLSRHTIARSSLAWSPTTAMRAGSSGSFASVSSRPRRSLRRTSERRGVPLLQRAHDRTPAMMLLLDSDGAPFSHPPVRRALALARIPRGGAIPAGLRRAPRLGNEPPAGASTLSSRGQIPRRGRRHRRRTTDM